MSTAMFYKWRATFGGMGGSMMKRQTELDDENKRLKMMYAEERLKVKVRQEALGKSQRAGSAVTPNNGKQAMGLWIVLSVSAQR